MKPLQPTVVFRCNEHNEQRSGRPAMEQEVRHSDEILEDVKPKAYSAVNALGCLTLTLQWL